MSHYLRPCFGLPHKSPFDILKQPRSEAIAPAKMPSRRGKVGVLTIHGLSKKADANISAFNVAIASRDGSDRTNSIRGRSL